MKTYRESPSTQSNTKFEENRVVRVLRVEGLVWQEQVCPLAAVEVDSRR
jgi:hypothetical protein